MPRPPTHTSASVRYSSDSTLLKLHTKGQVLGMSLWTDAMLDRLQQEAMPDQEDGLLIGMDAEKMSGMYLLSENQSSKW